MLRAKADFCLMRNTRIFIVKSITLANILSPSYVPCSSQTYCTFLTFSDPTNHPNHSEHFNPRPNSLR